MDKLWVLFKITLKWNSVFQNKIFGLGFKRFVGPNKKISLPDHNPEACQVLVRNKAAISARLGLFHVGCEV